MYVCVRAHRLPDGFMFLGRIHMPDMVLNLLWPLTISQKWVFQIIIFHPGGVKKKEGEDLKGIKYRVVTSVKRWV